MKTHTKTPPALSRTLPLLTTVYTQIGKTVINIGSNSPQFSQNPTPTKATPPRNSGRGNSSEARIGVGFLYLGQFEYLCVHRSPLLRGGYLSGSRYSTRTLRERVYGEGSKNCAASQRIGINCPQ
jgi:hypothetical protein